MTLFDELSEGIRHLQAGTTDRPSATMNVPRFSITPLSREHQKSGFCSGSDLLDRYFSERVGQDVRRNLTKCFVAIDNSHARIAGFYTLSAAQIPLLQLSEKLADKMLAQGDLTLPMPGLYVLTNADNMYSSILGLVGDADLYNPSGFVL